MSTWLKDDIDDLSPAARKVMRDYDLVEKDLHAVVPISGTNAAPHLATNSAETPEVVDIPVADLLPVADKSRINDGTVSNLVESFTAVGQIQPISVSRDTGHAGKWKLHGGAHRVLAAHKVGWTTIQALVFEREAEDLALIEIAENLHRKDLSIMERARLQNRWLEDRPAKGCASCPAWRTAAQRQGVRQSCSAV
jgi:hypothetical protein